LRTQALETDEGQPDKSCQSREVLLSRLSRAGGAIPEGQNQFLYHVLSRATPSRFVVPMATFPPLTKKKIKTHVF
jgi:hypothetical protein